MSDTPNHQLKVLIVEDSEIIAGRIRNMLSELKYITLVGSAKNFGETFVITSTTPPDVVLLDIKLPGKSGLEVLIEIKKKHPHTRVIMLTNFSEPHNRKTYREAGSDYFFDKSTEFEKIPAALISILQTKMN